VEHLQHFGLSQDPFSNEPDLRFYFESACHMDSLRRVDRGLRQNKGLTVLTGEPGTGKTLLTRRLFESLEEEIFEVSLMVILPGAADADTVLKRYARQLGVEEPAIGDRSALLGQMYEQLAIVREDGRHAVLIIDDAHMMSPEAMAEIGGLLNMEYEEKRLLSLFLVGLPDIDDRLNGDGALVQRVDVRVRLQSLDLRNCASYVAHRLTVVGGQLDLFPPHTVEALFKFGRGRPRLVNTLGDNALFEAFLGGRQQVETADIERAAGDLGIGPDPGTTYSQFAPPVAPPEHPVIAGDGGMDPVMGPSIDGPGSSASFSAPPAAAVADMADPFAELAIESAPLMAEPESGPTTDLSGLFDGEGAGVDDLTTALDTSSGTMELDEGVAAVLGEEPFAEAQPMPFAEPVAQAAEPLPTFSAQNANPNASAEVTRVDLDDEPQDLGGTGEVQDLDDLFVELIEE
jgi:type II secretory pathway predicted ATPase ExeA